MYTHRDEGKMRRDAKMLRFVGNVIWFILGGAIAALLWLLGSLIFALTIVGLPLSRAAFEMAKLSAAPFGKDVVHVRELDGRADALTAATGIIGFIFNVVWALTFGWMLFVVHVTAGILNCLTIIGIPFGLMSFKLAGISIWPIGRRVVTNELAHAARSYNARAEMDRMRG